MEPTPIEPAPEPPPSENQIEVSDFLSDDMTPEQIDALEKIKSLTEDHAWQAISDFVFTDKFVSTFVNIMEEETHTSYTYHLGKNEQGLDPTIQIYQTIPQSNEMNSYFTTIFLGTKKDDKWEGPAVSLYLSKNQTKEPEGIMYTVTQCVNGIAQGYSEEGWISYTTAAMIENSPENSMGDIHHQHETGQAKNGVRQGEWIENYYSPVDTLLYTTRYVYDNGWLTALGEPDINGNIMAGEAIFDYKGTPEHVYYNPEYFAQRRYLSSFAVIE